MTGGYWLASENPKKTTSYLELGEHLLARGVDHGQYGIAVETADGPRLDGRAAPGVGGHIDLALTAAEQPHRRTPWASAEATAPEPGNMSSTVSRSWS